MKNRNMLAVFVFITSLLVSCNTEVQKKPMDIIFHHKTLKRIGVDGDNWRTTWAKDGSLITSMCDGNWLGDNYDNSFHLYKKLFPKGEVVLGDNTTPIQPGR